MHDADRFRLIAGPYRMPRYRIGRLLRCTIRGEVRVDAISAGRIAWPQTRVGRPDRKGAGMLSMIVCGDLERAVRCESNQAVAYWWGVNVNTVSLWRKALGVGRATEGSSRLHRETLAELLDGGAREKLQASLRSPERAGKIGDAQRRRTRPAATVEKMRQARRGIRHTAEAREKMRQAQLARYAAVPRWSAADDALLGTMPDTAVAELLGTMPDTAVAELLGSIGPACSGAGGSWG
jgi:hypothetical protein